MSLATVTTVLQLVAVALTAWAAWSASESAKAAKASSQELQRTHALEQRPLVEMFAESREGGLYIVVENFGRHPAADVDIRFTQPVLNSKSNEVSADPIFHRPIPLLPPGKRLDVHIDNRWKFFDSHPQLQWPYTLQYSDPLLQREFSAEATLSVGHLEPPKRERGGVKSY